MVLKLFKCTLVGLSILFLTSCGQPVCVMGIGQCDAPDKPASSTSGALTVTSDATTIYASSSSSKPNTANITISGGTANYELSIYPSNTNIAYFLSGAAQVSTISGIASSVVLTAQNTVSTATNLNIVVYDSSNPRLTGNVIITVQPN